MKPTSKYIYVRAERSKKKHKKHRIDKSLSNICAFFTWPNGKYLFSDIDESEGRKNSKKKMSKRREKNAQKSIQVEYSTKDEIVYAKNTVPKEKMKINKESSNNNRNNDGLW